MVVISIGTGVVRRRCSGRRKVLGSWRRGREGRRVRRVVYGWRVARIWCSVVIEMSSVICIVDSV